MARRWASSTSSAHAAGASAASTAANIIRIPDLRFECTLARTRGPAEQITAHGKHVSGTGPKMWCSTSEGTRGGSAMIRYAVVGAVLLAAVGGGEVRAQAVVEDPGYCAQYY